MTTTTHTSPGLRRLALATYLAEHTPSAEGDALDDEAPERWLMVEENVGGSEPPYWASTFPTKAAALTYHQNQEYAADWQMLALVDLDTDTEADPAEVLALEATALDRITEVLRAADWSGVMYDEDALETIAAILAETGREVETP